MLRGGVGEPEEDRRVPLSRGLLVTGRTFGESSRSIVAHGVQEPVAD